MKKVIYLNVFLFLLAAIISCSNGSDDSTADSKAAAEETHTKSVSFLEDWETMQFLYINDGGKMDTKIDAPWNTEAASTLMSDNVRMDVKKEDGWEVAFNFMNKDGRPDFNYFGLYNKYTGVLRIFYYYNKEVATTATDFSFEVLLDSDKTNSQFYYSSLNYGIPMNADVNPNVNLLDAGNISKTFHFLVTPYSCVGRKTMIQGWYAFDIDMSAYTGKSFHTDGTSIKIACRTNNKTDVTLGTDFKGKIGGDIDISKAQASNNGCSSILADIATGSSSIAKALEATGKATSKDGSAWDAAGAAFEWISSGCQIASIIKKDRKDHSAMVGKADLKLNATAETKGYLESELSTNVKQFTMEKTVFNPDSNAGKGVWNIDESPVIYYVQGHDISKTGIAYFYDPTSFNVSINKDIFPDASNIKVLSYCGVYTNSVDKDKNKNFRDAIGIGKLEDIKIWHSGAIVSKAGENTLDAERAKLVFFNIDKSSYTISESSSGNTVDYSYYGERLCYDKKESPLNFIVEPEIDYTSSQNETIIGNGGIDFPNLYVIVILQFESGGKVFHYSRTYLPKVNKITYDESKNIVAGIKTRLETQSEKIYKTEYNNLMDQKMRLIEIMNSFPHVRF